MGTCLLYKSQYVFYPTAWKERKKKILWMQRETRAFGFVLVWNDFISDSRSTLFLILGETCAYTVTFLNNKFLFVTVSWSFHKLGKYWKDWEGKEYSWIKWNWWVEVYKLEKTFSILIAWPKEPDNSVCFSWSS